MRDALNILLIAIIVLYGQLRYSAGESAATAELNPLLMSCGAHLKSMTVIANARATSDFLSQMMAPRIVAPIRIRPATTAPQKESP